MIRASDPDASNAARSTVAPDPTREHTAYLVWARRRSAPASEARGAVGFSRTTDGGETWSEAREIYQTPIGMGTSANEIVVLPNGDLVNVFSEVSSGTQSDRSSHRVLGIRSTDSGLTWSKPMTVATASVAGIVDPRTGTRVRTGNSFNDIAVDPRSGTNTMYAVWEDARFTQERTEQIAFARSTDGGRTWSDPVAVSTDQEMQNFIPSVAVNDRGDVAVAWYSFAAAKSDTRALADSVLDRLLKRSRSDLVGAATGDVSSVRSAHRSLQHRFFLWGIPGSDGCRTVLLCGNDTHQRAQPRQPDRHLFLHGDSR